MRAAAALLALLALGSGSAAAASLVPIGGKVPDFAVRDQYDEPFRLSERPAMTIVLLCADREGSRWTGAWGKAVRDEALSTHARVELHYLADLRGVPRFMHGYVRGKFHPDEQPRHPVLLDWSGEAHRIFGLKPRVVNAFVIDSLRTLVADASGQGAAAEIEAFRASLRRVFLPDSTRAAR